jgi:hypothetical protein
MVSPARNDVDLSDVPNVTKAELGREIDRLKIKKTAPGPDGIPAQVLGIALKHLGERLRQLFDECLKSRQFPKPWKAGKLCLIQKPDRSTDTSAAYRPIVLLDEVGRFLRECLRPESRNIWKTLVQTYLRLSMGSDQENLPLTL